MPSLGSVWLICEFMVDRWRKNTRMAIKAIHGPFIYVSLFGRANNNNKHSSTQSTPQRNHHGSANSQARGPKAVCSIVYQSPRIASDHPTLFRDTSDATHDASQNSVMLNRWLDDYDRAQELRVALASQHAQNQQNVADASKGLESVRLQNNTR